MPPTIYLNGSFSAFGLDLEHARDIVLSCKVHFPPIFSPLFVSVMSSSLPPADGSAFALTGCLISICGNIMISVSLNLQKYVHNQLRQSPQRLCSSSALLPDNEEKSIGFSTTDYLRHPLWWVGITLMAVGELGNFAAYGYSPAILVAPLGTVALITNAIIAPIFLQEKIEQNNLIGIALAVLGTIMIVLASTSTDEPVISPDKLLELMARWPFVIYVLITVMLMVFLTSSSPKYGHKYILWDLGLVAVYGGYTVLSTKALSSLLHLPFSILVTHFITYFLVAILAITSVLQIRYLNRSLANFDAVAVIPTQFVLFTLSAIVSSAVLFQDLANMKSGALTISIVSVFTLFVGVWLITKRTDRSDGFESIDDDYFAPPSPVIASAIFSSPTTSLSRTILAAPTPAQFLPPNSPSSRRLNSNYGRSFELGSHHPHPHHPAVGKSLSIQGIFESVGIRQQRKIEYDALFSEAGGSSGGGGGGGQVDLLKVGTDRRHTREICLGRVEDFIV